jgi:hypothetical protein
MPEAGQEWVTEGARVRPVAPARLAGEQPGSKPRTCNGFSLLPARVVAHTAARREPAAACSPRTTNLLKMSAWFYRAAFLNVATL